LAGKIIVSGTGCCLVDLLYITDFSSRAISSHLSFKRGDGGLSPGKLVFEEEFKKYSKTSLDNFIKEIAGGKKPDGINIGGPSIVSLIHAAQLSDSDKCEVRFYGRAGDDPNGRYIISSLEKTPVILKDFRLIRQRTPSTIVLSDPHYDNGHGERMFINSIGAAWHFHPEDIDDDFFNSDIVVFGGTALVPQIHDNLNALLAKAKSHDCMTIVNTVFDFRNEKADPSSRWPLGDSDDNYRLTDLLIADKEEALRLSGQNDIGDAVEFFTGKGLSAFMITDGASPVKIFSDGSLFQPVPVTSMPVSQSVLNDLKTNKRGDTTGCGDNFAGGVIFSLVSQLNRNKTRLDITDACIWGIVSGGFTCFYMGGTYFEKERGEKMGKIMPYYNACKRQI